MQNSLKQSYDQQHINIRRSTRELFSDLNTISNAPKVKPYTTEAVLCFLRHGMTDINKDKDSLKHDNTPLSKEEFDYKHQDESEYQPGTVAYQALQIKKAILGHIDQIRISVPFSITRDVQTAHILADVLDLPFPTDLKAPLPSWLCDEEDLRTSRKDLEKIEEIQKGPTKYLISDELQESKLEVLGRHARVFKKLLSTDDTSDIKYKIAIGHRTGSAFLDSLKHGKNTLDFEAKKYGPATLLMGSLDKEGKFVNGLQKRFFEFDVSNYAQQLQELGQIQDIGVTEEKSLIENQNIVNDYLQGKLLSQLFVVKSEEGREKRDIIVENMRKYLYSDHELIRNYTLYHIFDNMKHLDTPQSGLQIQALLMEFIEHTFGSESKDNEEKKIALFKEFYTQKGHSDLWKYALKKLHDQDPFLIAKLGEYSKHPDIERECKYIEYADLGKQIEPAYKMYMKSGRMGKEGYRHLGNKDARTQWKTSPENFGKFAQDILKIDKHTLKKAALGRLKTVLEDTGLDTYFYTKANGLMSFLQGQNQDGTFAIKLPIKEQQRNEIVLLLKILDFTMKGEDLDRIIHLLIGPEKKDHIQEIIKSLEEKSDQKIDNVVDLIFIGTAQIQHLLGRKSRLDILDFLVKNGIGEAKQHLDKQYEGKQTIMINNNLLMQLSKILRGPIIDQVRTFIQRQLHVSNVLDCLDIGGDGVKSALGGPRKLGNIRNLALHENMIYGEGDTFAHTRFTSEHIMQLSEKLRGSSSTQLKTLLSKKNIDIKNLANITPENFYYLLAPHKKFSIHKLIGNILGRNISNITPLELQNLSSHIQ